MYYFVYLTRNLINNKIYVGVHSCEDLSNDKYLGSGRDICKAIAKHGHEHFERHILHFAINEDEAYEIESWIVDTNFIKRRDTYNLTPGGKKPPSHKGKKMSDEQKRKIGNANRNPSAETIEKKRAAGRNISDETRKKRSEKLKGRSVPEEHIRKLAEMRKGQPMSDEQKRKISAKLKGVPKPPRSKEHQEKLANANRGKHFGPRSEETKRKISEGRRKRQWSAD